MQDAETPDVSDGRGRKKGERARQSISCAECRRLKLKCSREWPCTSCQKRGCAQICPDGEMRTVRGRRLIMGDTEDLYQRVLTLETALAESHTHRSSEPHPLLTKTYHQARPRRFVPSLDPDDGDQVVEQAFGTLTIGLGGEARFVGSLAGSEYLNGNEPSGNGTFSPRRDPDMSGWATPPLTAGVVSQGGADLAQLELLGLATGSLDSVSALRELLPKWEDEGRGAVESYWENVNWMYQIIPRPMFDNDHLANAFDNTVAPHAHKLACVFLVMALGVLFDLNRRPYDRRSKELYNLGVRCIQAGGFQRPSPALVQALHLCGTFLLNDNDESGAETLWPLLGSATKIAQRLGLHRDGETFGLSPYEVKERRQIWWEMVTHDRLQSLCFGRPCSTSNKASDTRYPEGDELVADKDHFHKQKYGLVRLIEQVIDLQTKPAPVSLKQVLAIDQEFQEFFKVKATLPDDLLPNTPIESLPLENTIHPHLILHRLGIRLLIAQTRLLLNRPAFSRALRDRPEDPAVGSMGIAFVALYESALDIVQLVKALVIYHPSLISRWWFYWHHAASACVCLSAITIQAPNCAFSSPAFHAISSIVDICKASKEGSRAKRMLPTLLRLQGRASEALRIAIKSGRQSGEDPASCPDDDLDHLQNSARLRRAEPPRQPIDAEFNEYVRYSASPTPRPTSAGRLPHSTMVTDDASPVSMSSIATSDTMVEVIVNEYGGQIWSLPLRGAVPTPPPEGTTLEGPPARSPLGSRVKPKQSLKRPRRSTVQATGPDEASVEQSIPLSGSATIDAVIGTALDNSSWQPMLLSHPVPTFGPPTWVVASPPPRPPIPAHNRTNSYPPVTRLAPLVEADERGAGSSGPSLSGDANAAYQYILSQVGLPSYFATPHGSTAETRHLVPAPEIIATGLATLSETPQLPGEVIDPLNFHSPDQLEGEDDFDFDMFVHHMPDGYVVNE